MNNEILLLPLKIIFSCVWWLQKVTCICKIPYSDRQTDKIIYYSDMPLQYMYRNILVFFPILAQPFWTYMPLLTVKSSSQTFLSVISFRLQEFLTSFICNYNKFPTLSNFQVYFSKFWPLIIHSPFKRNESSLTRFFHQNFGPMIRSRKKIFNKLNSKRQVVI